jgi:hypothetical protein
MRPRSYKLPYHDISKQEILSIIDNLPGDEFKSFHNFQSNIYKGDWKLESKKEYFEIFWKYNEQFLNDVFKNSVGYSEKWIITDIWFQQYVENNTHNWHHHNNTMWNFVYYLESSNDSPGTEFIEPFTKEHLYENPEEGSLLMFPSQYIHRSPLNNSKSRKTIIAFNVNYTDE